MEIDFKLITEHRFTGLIWKMEVDTNQELLFIETRNAENHTAAFSSFSLKTGENYFLELVLEEKWLIGMEGSRNEMLFLHSYSSPQSPEHKAIIALDAFTGKQVWADYNLSAETFITTGLLAADQRFQNKKTVLLDYKTGKILQKPDQLHENSQQITSPLILFLPPKNLADLIADEIVGEISLVNYNPYLIISLHTQKNGVLQQQLFIIEDDVIIYQEILNEQIQKLQPEAFIVVKNHLIYLKNKIILKVLNLN